MSIFKNIEEIGSEPTDRKNPSTPPIPKTEEKIVDKEPVFINEEKKETPKFFIPDNENENTTSNTSGLHKLSKEKAKESGATNAYLYSGVQDTILQAANLIWYVTRFNDSEKEKIVSIQEKPQEQWTSDEVSLNNKFLAINKKWEKKKEKSVMTEKEIEELEKGFALYAEISGKEQNPAMIIAAVITRSLCTKLMDIYIG